MDGVFSFVEQGCESKRPVSETKTNSDIYDEGGLYLQCTGTRRANSVRAAFLGTFSAVGKSASPAGANTGNVTTEQPLTPCHKV